MSVLALVLSIDNLWAIMILTTAIPLLLYSIQSQKNDEKRKRSERVPMLDSILEKFFYQATGVMCALTLLAIMARLVSKFLK